MNKRDRFKYLAIKAIIKAYFFGALYFSFTTLTAGAAMLGMHHAWRGPAIVDGIAVIGFILRSETFSRSTRKLGFWMQLVAGTLSLIGNVAAGQTIGDKIADGAMVVIYLGSELIYDRIESAEVDRKRERDAIIAKEAAIKAAEDARLAAEAKAAADRAAALEAARIAAEVERERIAAAERSERAVRAAATRAENKAAEEKELRRAERRSARLAKEALTGDYNASDADVPVSGAPVNSR